MGLVRLLVEEARVICRIPHGSGQLPFLGLAKGQVDDVIPSQAQNQRGLRTLDIRDLGWRKLRAYWMLDRCT